MTRKAVLLSAVLSVSLTFVFGQQEATRKERLERTLYFLASDSLRGREAGSADAAKAADYIKAQFEAMALQPFSDDGFDQYFTENGVRYRNVVGKIEGTLKDEYIIVGAHYDHLGVDKDKIYHGADDNASGTSALIELAREVVSKGVKPKRTIVFAAFDAEELGLYGSKHLASVIEPQKVRLMISMDMVGWLKGGKLSVEGTGTLAGCRPMLRKAADRSGIRIKGVGLEKSLFTGTDTEYFAEKRIPTLYVNTGTDSPYHKPADTADKIDYDGLDKIVTAMDCLVGELGAADEIRPTGRLSFKHAPMPAFECGLTFGIGNNRHYYPHGALDGKHGFACSAGLYGQYNMPRFLSLRGSAIYENRSAQIPDTHDVLGTSHLFTQQSVTIPVDVILRTSGKTYAYVCGGGYYSRILSSAQDGVRLDATSSNIVVNEYGWQWGLGVCIYKIYIESSSRYALNRVLTSNPEIHNRTTYCRIGIRF